MLSFIFAVSNGCLHLTFRKVPPRRARFVLSQVELDRISQKLDLCLAEIVSMKAPTPAAPTCPPTPSPPPPQTSGPVRPTHVPWLQMARVDLRVCPILSSLTVWVWSVFWLMIYGVMHFSLWTKFRIRSGREQLPLRCIWLVSRGHFFIIES